MQPANALSGQVAVVTGAGRGIGRAVAAVCAAEGARVVLAARSAEELEKVAEEIRADGGKALALPTDVTDRESVGRMMHRVEAEWGTVDLLVNNAARFAAIGPVWEVDPETWRDDVTTNLYGPFLCCRAVLPGMLALGRGRIVNLMGGGTGSPFPYGSGYASSKAAVMRLAECLAEELRRAGAPIAVFALEPGLVRTAITEYHLESPEGKRWLTDVPTAFAQGRDVPPTRAAALTVALASGRFDRLAGRYFDVADDPEEILRRQDEIVREDRKTLRLRGLGRSGRNDG